MQPDQLGLPPLGMTRTDSKPLVKTWNEGWQPRWEGDLGDPFEPYQVLIVFSCKMKNYFMVGNLISIGDAETRRTYRKWIYIKTGHVNL